MKLTLANIKELKRNSDSPLLKRVCNYVIDRWSDYNDKKGIFTDVLHYGCQSIYYSDTVRFYKQYRQEINTLLYDLMNGTGLYSPTELFGDKWDRLRRIFATKTFWRGSALKKRSGTSATTSKLYKIAFEENTKIVLISIA